MKALENYLISIAFQSIENLKPIVLGMGTICIKQCSKPTNRKLRRNQSKPLNFRFQSSNDSKTTNTGSLEYLIL